MLADALIAATATEYNTTLTSANIKHFRIVLGLVLQAFEQCCPQLVCMGNNRV